MKVLVAIDGSPQAVHALARAIELFGATTPPTPIALINVHDDAFIRRHQHQVGKEAVDEYMADLHKADLADARALLESRGVQPHEVICANGELVPTIAARASAGGYDLIVMGSKGRGSVADLVLGSVVQRVLAVSKVPVLVVP